MILGDEMGLGKTIQVQGLRGPLLREKHVCMWHLRESMAPCTCHSGDVLTFTCVGSNPAGSSAARTPHCWACADCCAPVNVSPGPCSACRLAKVPSHEQALAKLPYDNRAVRQSPQQACLFMSRIGAWERELAKWAPGLAVLPYIGGQAARDIIQR